MASPIRDPYKVLGISPDASDDQLHAAYRRLVQLHHPDHNAGSVESARRFEEIQDAYARIRKLRARPASEARAGRRPPADPASEARSARQPVADPDVERRLADLERELRNARTARDRARRAAADAARSASRRPSDEELGYVTTDDSFAKILADARAELSDRLTETREHPVGQRVAALIDELAAKLKGVD